MIKKFTIIGVGLIGGSLARALKRIDMCEYIVGSSRNKENLEKAIELGVIDSYSTDPAVAVADADMVLLASPISAYEQILKKIKPAIPPHTVITDAGSSKGSVIKIAQKTLGSILPRFVPGHPIAGTEKSGVESSFAELFKAHRVILTPLPETDGKALRLVSDMWTSIGADVITMGHEHHDSVLAATSHLPHLLAYALVDCLARKEEREEIFHYASGGFADFTRIASSDPKMWHDICLSNRQHLLRMIEEFDQHLRDIEAAIRDENTARILTIFTRAKKIRDQFTDQRGLQN